MWINILSLPNITWESRQNPMLAQCSKCGINLSMMANLNPLLTQICALMRTACQDLVIIEQVASEVKWVLTFDLLDRLECWLWPPCQRESYGAEQQPVTSCSTHFTCVIFFGGLILVTGMRALNICVNSFDFNCDHFRSVLQTGTICTCVGLLVISCNWLSSAVSTLNFPLVLQIFLSSEDS